MNQEGSSLPSQEFNLLKWNAPGNEASVVKEGVGGCGPRGQPKGPVMQRYELKEAVGLGAKVLATACPFCLLTLEDAVKISGLADQIVIKDIAELVSESIDSNTNNQAPSSK